MSVIRSFALVLAATAWSSGASAYSASANVVVNFGGNGGGIGVPQLGAAGILTTPNADVTWTYAGGGGQLYVMTNDTYFSNQGGFNGLNYYNMDFATADLCNSYGAGANVRKYGCRFTDYSGNSFFVRAPISDDGPGGRAGGTLVVTDTTLTGTLQLLSSTDEPTGAVANFVTAGGAAISSTPGVGTNGYNYRGADGSPFGNFWYGTTTQGTLEFSLTGTFTATSWNINGGTVRYNDPGFLCQHGGSGSLPADPSAGVFCASLPFSGVKQHNGAHLSWGWDVDGNGPTTAISEIEVRDPTGQVLITSLAGVLASLSVDGAGNITTNDGEFRRATDSQGACAGTIRWDGTRMTCGAFTVGKVNITGSVVPVPGAVWLFGSALGVTAFLRRRSGS